MTMLHTFEYVEIWLAFDYSLPIFAIVFNFNPNSKNISKQHIIKILVTAKIVSFNIIKLLSKYTLTDSI